MFSEIIFSESSLQTVIFAVGASRVTVWRAEVSIVALSGIAMMLLLRSKPCEGEEGWKGLAPLKSTFPVNITVVASFVAERRFYGAWASVVTVHMLSWPSACGTFPDEGSTMSPALAGGFLTSGLPEIPSLYLF